MFQTIKIQHFGFLLSVREFTEFDLCILLLAKTLSNVIDYINVIGNNFLDPLALVNEEPAEAAKVFY